MYKKMWYVALLSLISLSCAQPVKKTVTLDQQWQKAIEAFAKTGDAPSILASAQRVVAQGYDAKKVLSDALVHDIPSIVGWLLDTKNIDASMMFDDRNILMQAAFARAPHTIELLLGRGFKVNEKNVSGKTVLMYGALGGWPDVVKLLVEQKADVTAHDPEGNSVAQYALKGAATTYGNIQGGLDPYGTLSYLLAQLQMQQQEAFNINEQNNNGWTVLMTAANMLMPDIVELLITQYQARTDIKNNDGKTAADVVRIAIAAYKDNLPTYKKQMAQATDQKTKELYQKAIDTAEHKLKQGERVLELLVGKRSK